MTTVAKEPAQLDGPLAEVWAPGSAVLALGDGESGDQAVALWQISPDGQPTGAWVIPCAEAYQDRDAALQLLANLERRALTALDPDTLDDVLSRLTSVAGIDAPRWWTSQRFSPPDAFADLLARRAEFEATVASVRQAGRSVAPVTWARTFAPTEHPKTTQDLQQLANIGDLTAAPVIAEALKLSRLLRWLTEVWAETEQLKGRRDYVRDKHGEPEALPPSWLAAVITAGDTRLPL